MEGNKGEIWVWFMNLVYVLFISIGLINVLSGIFFWDGSKVIYIFLEVGKGGKDKKWGRYEVRF